MSRERKHNPYASLQHPIQHRVWNEGYEAGQRTDPYTNTSRIAAHQAGVKAGRDLERDKIGEQLILMAQEYGHAQFVFTADNLEQLNVQVSELSSTLTDIETLR